MADWTAEGCTAAALGELEGLEAIMEVFMQGAEAGEAEGSAEEMDEEMETAAAHGREREL
jgi:hypothetical protein